MDVVKCLTLSALSDSRDCLAPNHIFNKSGFNFGKSVVKVSSFSISKSLANNSSSVSSLSSTEIFSIRVEVLKYSIGGIRKSVGDNSINVFGVDSYDFHKSEKDFE